MRYKQKKDTNNEKKNEEYSVTNYVPSYFNVFKCAGNILETLVNYNDRNNWPLPNEKIQQAASRVIEETEEEEHDAECNVNHVTMNTISPFHYFTISQW